MNSKMMDAETIKGRRKDYTYNQYPHGGSRIYIDGGAGDRQLLVDTHYDEAFAKYIDGCVRDYFDLPESDRN